MTEEVNITIWKLVVWLMCQAFVIGFLKAQTTNEIKSGTLNCSVSYAPRVEYGIFAAAIPLVLVIPSDPAVDQYCAKKGSK